MTKMDKCIECDQYGTPTVQSAKVLPLPNNKLLYLFTNMYNKCFMAILDRSVVYTSNCQSCINWFVANNGYHLHMVKVCYPKPLEPETAHLQCTTDDLLDYIDGLSD